MEMINLLSTTQQKEMKAARSNTVFLRYIFILSGAVLFIIGALGVTYVFLDTSARQAEQIRADNEANTAGYQQTAAAASGLRSQISDAKTLFDAEIQYSKALTRLAELLPSGTALTSIELKPETFNASTTLSILVTGESAADRLREAFASSPYITSAQPGNLTINNDNSTYPYTVEFTVTIDRSIIE